MPLAPQLPPVSAQPSRARAAPARALLFATATFLSAFLLFEVQLVAGKSLLPRFGGAPAVWTTCMLFFQALLLAGYAWAHAAARLPGRVQAALHLALLAAAVAQVALAPAVAARGAGSAGPVLDILARLTASVALPVLALSASSPLLQAWAARGGERAPYRLYALSNAGSLAGLLAYPLLVERSLSLTEQTRAWFVAFGAFALLAAWCALGLVRASGAPPAPPRAPEGSTAGERRFLWLALPACASALLLAVTNELCQEVAVVPLLWVLPLALYLLSFVVTFARRSWYVRTTWMPVLVLALAVLGQAATLGAHVGVVYAVPVYTLGLFVCCAFLHGELAALRPAPERLTAFYLHLALGGALGGASVALLAPLLFHGYDELHAALLACGALAAAQVLRDPAYRRPRGGAWHPLVLALVVVVLLIALALGTRVLGRARPDVRAWRDFYGILRVHDLPAAGGVGPVRTLTHGATRHGQQFLDTERRTEPTAYYGHASGIGLLLDARAGGPPLRVGIVGLGAGVLAAYGRAGDVQRFYELDPKVVAIAEREFTFLADSAATIEIVTGDARLSLAAEQDQRFDVLALDAFSSDAIPVHLLTLEAFALYARHLAPGGLLALHVTSRTLDLAPLVQALAERSGMRAWLVESASDEAAGVLDARWILLTTSGELTGERLRSAARPLDSAETPRPWTDDYSDLLAVLDRGP